MLKSLTGEVTSIDYQGVGYIRHQVKSVLKPDAWKQENGTKKIKDPRDFNKGQTLMAR